jgi:hypothetical protein
MCIATPGTTEYSFIAKKQSRLNPALFFSESGYFRQKPFRSLSFSNIHGRFFHIENVREKMKGEHCGKNRKETQKKKDQTCQVLCLSFLFLSSSLSDIFAVSENL